MPTSTKPDPLPVAEARSTWWRGSKLDEAAFILFLGIIFALGTGFGTGVVFFFLHFTNCLKP